ncbi:MAG TPA: GNAT family N-acetyltransferase [Planctomycetota bacterium]|nr:GNAT family N-acetyltransferase [Planctomycetota bacterium]
MNLTFRRATLDDADTVAAILCEAALWLESRGSSLWRSASMTADAVRPDVEAGLFFIASDGGSPVGVFKFQLEDKPFWPEMAVGDAAYVHRVAVRRSYAGKGVSSAMLNFAAERARSLGLKWLRLDCDAKTPKLRAVYEKCGFQYHSDKDMGAFVVARYQLPLGIYHEK